MKREHARRDRGYAMAALLVSMSIMSILLGVALPAWRGVVQREREAELIFRGEQYAQAIALFNRRTGGFPTSLAALVEGRYIRQLYKDPITGGDFQPVFLGQGAPLTPPVVPGRSGSSAAGTGSQPAAGRGQAPQPAGRGRFGATGAQGGSSSPAAQPGRGTPPFTGGAGPFGAEPGAMSVGPIIGVVSRSTNEAMRLYEGRGRYNEWVFVSTEATQQPGTPLGGIMPEVPGLGPDGRGRGGEIGVGGRGGRGRGGPPPGRGPGGFQPPPFGLPGTPGGPGGPPGAPSPFPPGRGRL